MRPRRIWRGNPMMTGWPAPCRKCFNEAAPNLARKFRRYAWNSRKTSCFNEAAPNLARKWRAPRLSRISLQSFNEAAPNLARKYPLRCAVSHRDTASMRPRRIWRGNGLAHGRNLPPAGASMRPRRIWRGNVIVREPQTLESGFNEAAPNLARKFRHPRRAQQSL